MTAPADPARLIAGLPGWAGAEWSRLASGSNNTAFLIAKDGRRAVLKVALRERDIGMNSRRQEADVQARAAAAKLAPRVLYVDERMLVEEYLPGRTWTAADLGAPARLRELAGCLRRVHALPPTGRVFPLVEAAERYRTRLPAGTEATFADEQLEIVRAVRVQSRCCCHNDVVAGNVRQSGELHLLDWEYAADNDPLFDLATVAEHHGLDPAREAVLLEAYFGNDAAVHADAYVHMRRVYAALTWLWAAARP